MIRARELAQAELALARDRAAAEELKKKEEEKRDTRSKDPLQPNSTSSPPVGSGGSRAKGLRLIKKKKIQKKAPVLTRRVLTRQARGRTVVSQ
jgi:phenylalanyl-tRNA synthetase beta subunit